MGNLGPIISIIRISLRKRRKKGGRKCNVYETIGRVVLATRQPEIPWKQERKKKKKKGSLLHGSQRANFIRQLFSLPRLWTIPPLPSSDNNTPTLAYNSKLLSSSRKALTLPLREKWRPRGWIRDSRVGKRCLPSGDERFIALNRGGSRALFDLERSFDPVEIDVRD